MVKEIPDRLCVNSKDPFFSEDVKRVEVYLNGVRRIGDCVAYCISEGWIEVYSRKANGKPKVERGRYVPIRLKGVVEVKWKET